MEHAAHVPCGVGITWKLLIEAVGSLGFKTNQFIFTTTEMSTLTLHVSLKKTVRKVTEMNIVEWKMRELFHINLAWDCSSPACHLFQVSCSVFQSLS